MKTLLVMRHAKSDWETGKTDHERPLNSRGKEDAPLMGAWLKEKDVVPEWIISSTAVRARQTALGVIEGSGYEEEWEQTHSFYHADPEAYVEKLATLPDRLNCVMVVGHNPGIEELVEWLTGESVLVTTGNVAEIRLPIDHWKQITAVGEDDELLGELANFWQPRALPKI
jgi:phosphohistidine phosphatase